MILLHRKSWWRGQDWPWVGYPESEQSYPKCRLADTMCAHCPQIIPRCSAMFSFVRLGLLWKHYHAGSGPQGLHFRVSGSQGFRALKAWALRFQGLKAWGLGLVFRVSGPSRPAMRRGREQHLGEERLPQVACCKAGRKRQLDTPRRAQRISACSEHQNNHVTSMPVLLHLGQKHPEQLLHTLVTRVGRQELRAQVGQSSIDRLASGRKDL